jgi:hypothetical protein
MFLGLWRSLLRKVKAFTEIASKPTPVEAPRSLQKIPRAKLISGNTASNESFTHAKEWLEICLQNHTTCQKQGHPSLPTRLLDLRAISIANGEVGHGLVKLIASRDAIAEGTMLPDCKYVCLSHCWGKKPIITTTSKNIPDLMMGTSLGSFPKTFQHAMIITIKLGASYLWIDSLCICQDSASDWEHESKQMANIYNGAVFTIAASRATGAADGCFSEAARRYQGEEIVAHLEDGSTFPVWVRRPIDHNTWPLLKRAWVMQERLLSHRIIHFSNEEMAWECMERSTCECLRVVTSWPASNSIDSKAQHQSSLTSESRSKLADEWRDMVCSYTGMGLTFEKDIFPALSGLAKTTQTQIRHEYCAGMWRDSLLVDMLWRCLNSSDTRPQVWRAPSWSWASVLGAVTYDTMGGRKLVESAVKAIHAELKDVQVQRAGTDEHGGVLPGYVTLQGFLAPVEAYYDGRYPYYPHLRLGQEERISPQWDDPVIDGQFKADISLNIYLLKMATTTSKGSAGDDVEEELICLVVLCLDENTSRFTRLGYLSRYWPEKEQWFKDAKERVITIH